MKTLTVFTPTYNRAYCLHQLYESLCRQTSSDFEWLIIDDGSTDHTKELVESWIKEGKVVIHYVYKENGGMHTGHNKAYELIETELNVCIDSDDFMPDDAVEIIINNSKVLSERFAGLIGLDIDKKGEVIGTKMPDNISECTLTQLHQKYSVKGDKKLVYRTKVVKKFPPYPTYEGEKFVPLGYLYRLIDRDYVLKPINKPLVVVEYLEDGSSMNILKQYRENPRGFAFVRIYELNQNNNFSTKFKNAIHLISSTLFAKDLNLLKKANQPLITFLAIPFGVILNFYIRIKTCGKI
jgi:glycosyltransferase involved in cell wall biosynthesis